MLTKRDIPIQINPIAESVNAGIGSTKTFGTSVAIEKYAMRIKPILILVAAATLLTAANTGNAWVINTLASPSGPLDIGDEFTVNLTLSGWFTSDPEVDGFTFRVDFDESVFELVPGSVQASDTFLQNNQGTGFSFDDNSTVVDADTVIFDARDDPLTKTPTGAGPTAGGGGNLASFRLRAIAPGTGDIDPLGDSNTTFFDVDGIGISATGGGVFVGTSMEVVPEPATSVVMAVFAAGTWLTGRRRRLVGNRLTM